MGDTMLGKLIRLLVTIPELWLGLLIELVEKLRSRDKAVWASQLVRFLRNEPCWLDVKDVTESQFSVLDFLGRVSIPRRTKSLIAKDEFVRDVSRSAKPRIGSISENFRAYFLSGEGKVEGVATEVSLRFYTLLKPAVNASIVAELGGEGKSETTLTDMFILMKRQGNGWIGDLLVNGYSNIFFINDNMGVLRFVSVTWTGGSWSVDAGPISCPRGWRGGDVVVSRSP